MAEAQSLVRGRNRAGFAGARWLVVLALALVTACAPTVQAAMRAPSAFAGPRFAVEEQRFYSFDGAPLGLSAWPAQSNTPPWAVIIALHGMNDYAEAFYLAGPRWAQAGITTYAYDARGFGRSPQRGVWGGQALMTEDVRTAVAVARQRHPGAIVAVVGDSMGAATAMAAFASDRPPNADRLVLVAPAVWGWSTMPPLYSASLIVGAYLFGASNVRPPREVQVQITPSDNIDMLRKIGRDPNMLFETRVDAVFGLVELMETASKAAPQLKGPTLFLYGAKDQIIPRASAVRVARALPPQARSALYADGYHMLLRDLQASRVHDDIIAFIRAPEAALPSGAPALLSKP
jgi:alpha-beta hydrolase superfamily lysophospholipase